MDQNQWIKHIERRSDLSTKITHLTKRTENESSLDVLIKILNERVLIGSKTDGFIVGNNSAVCFQDVPIQSLAENIKYEGEVFVEEHKRGKTIPRYCGFGLRFNKESMYQKGARPVIYDNTGKMKDMLPPEEHWRIVNLDLSNPDRMVDWTHEREWRIKGDFAFDYSDVEVIIGNEEPYHKFVNYYLDNNPDVLREIKGIIILKSIIN